MSQTAGAVGASATVGASIWMVSAWMGASTLLQFAVHSVVGFGADICVSNGERKNMDDVYSMHQGIAMRCAVRIPLAHPYMPAEHCADATRALTQCVHCRQHVMCRLHFGFARVVFSIVLLCAMMRAMMATFRRSWLV